MQALAALVIREQMVSIAAKNYQIAFQVHDEIVIAAHKTKALIAQTDLEAVMSTPPSWALDLPVACESGYAENYGDA